MPNSIDDYEPYLGEHACIDIDTAIDIAFSMSNNGLIDIPQKTKGYAVTTNVDAGSVVTLTPHVSTSTDYIVAECTAGDVFVISGSGWNAERLWAFVDQNDRLLSKSDSGATAASRVLTCPYGAAKIVCNFRTDTEDAGILLRFDKAGATIHASRDNITSSTGALICSNNLNNLPANTVYGLVPYAGLQNVPYQDTGTSKGGIIMTLSKERAANSTQTQLLVRRDGRVYIRQYWTSAYESWKEYRSFEEVENAVNSATALAVKGKAVNITSSNVEEICNGDANNLPNNSVYGISVAYNEMDNLPPYVYTLSGSQAKNAGSVITFGKESGRGYGDTQIFVGYGSQTYVRVYAGTWQVWRRLSGANYTRILGLGDSICEGWRNENMGFVGMLGVPYTNKGITGATLGQTANHTQIYTEMDNLEGNYDCIISDGGINDYYFNVPLGTASAHPIVNSTQAAALDKTTVSGGLEYLFYLMIDRCPNAQRYFLITHKTNAYPYTENTAGYTQQQLHDRIVEICKLYNVQVIDIYEESLINSEFSVYVSPTAYSTDHGVTTQYHVDKDGIHPLWLGYFHGYLPIIEKALQTASKKG